MNVGFLEYTENQICVVGLRSYISGFDLAKKNELPPAKSALAS